jgi:phosphonoacetate hydrolase
MTRQEAARRFHLMAERIGELIVLGDKDTVFGDLGDDFEALPPTLRTHGSFHETEIPMIIYNASGPLPPADRLRYNFDMTRDLFRGGQ